MDVKQDKTSSKRQMLCFHPYAESRPTIQHDGKRETVYGDQ
jgi:hypothetical protein